jgi:hypothetical protein
MSLFASVQCLTVQMRLLLITAFVAATSSCERSSVVPKSQPMSAADAAAVAEFNASVKNYAEMRDGLERQLPKLGEEAEAAKIDAHRKALAAAVQKQRSGAQAGEIFTPAVRDYFHRIIRSETRGPTGKASREAIKEGNPRFEPDAGGRAAVKVNAPYPEKAPVSVVPPAMLIRLPQLPEELQYGFVGRDLILRDAKTGLVLDILPAAAPPLKGNKS